MRDFLRESWDVLTRGAASLCGMLAALYGGFDGALRLLAGMMAADYLSGLLVAALGKSRNSAHGRLSAAACFRGLAKKGLTMLVVLVAALVDRVTGEHALLRNAAAWFYIGSEAISLLENLSRAGVPVPGALRRALESFRSANEQAPDALPGA